MDLFREATAGCAGGVLGIVIGHPLDTVRVRLQVQGEGGVRYHGMVDCIRRTLRREGARGFFKGIGPPILANATLNTMLFGVYGFSSRLIEESPVLGSQRKAVRDFLAGSVAGAVQCIVVGPSDLIKVRMQTQDGSGTQRYRSSWHCTQMTVQREGIRGLMRGMSATMMRDVGSFGLYYAFYFGSKDALEPYLGGSGAVLTAGGIAGIAAWGSTYPFDIIKSRVQNVPPGKPQLRMMDVARALYRETGWSAFSRGLGVTLLRSIPVNMFTFGGYEACLYLFEYLHT